MDVDQSPNWKPNPEDTTEPQRYQFNRFVRLLMAAGLSYRKAAKVGNGLLEDLMDIGLLPKDDNLLFTKAKIQREVNRIGKMDANEHLKELKKTKITSIGHDGKASKTLQNNRKVTVESKVTFMKNDTRGYITHKIPADGTGEELANCLYEVSFFNFCGF